ncbi:MAG: hypothetical protein C5B50_02195 [Verrucomicrobia bacterium]|nr:MAG: hypothetical protein C5B50_02195 [Verrucomicrobiota bacterium]
MKLTLALIVVSLCLATKAWGQDYIIKQRARELSNQNNVRQGAAAPVEPTPATPATKPAATPQPNPALGRLKSDLAAIQAGSQVTAQQKQKITADIIALASGTAKPSQASAAKLAESLCAAYSEKPLSDSSRLLRDLEAVLNPTKYPQAKWDAIFADVQAIFQENGAARKNAVKVADDVRAIGAEVKN